MFFKHFASKKQLPDLSVNLTLVENGLTKNTHMNTLTNIMELIQLLPVMNFNK